MGLASPVRAPERVWFAHALRGVACGIVVLYHLCIKYEGWHAVATALVALPPNAANARPIWLDPALALERFGVDFGQIGVAIFFLISGFVIPFSLRRGGAAAFAIRRVLRIYPVFWLTLAGTVILIGLQARHAGTVLPFHRTDLLPNALLLHLYVGAPVIDGVSWTLTVEELFYVTAALLALCGLLRSTVALIAVGVGFGSVVLAADLYTGASPVLYSLTHGGCVVISQVLCLLAGVALHHHFRRDWSTARTAAVIVGLMAIFLASMWAGPNSGRALTTSVSNLIGALTFVAAYGVREHLPRLRLLSWLADISYPLYLVHGVTGYLVLPRLLDLTHHLSLAVAGTLALVLAIAWVVHVAIEQPSIALARRLTARTHHREPVRVAA